MLILATLLAIAALPVVASAALGTMPTVLHVNDRPTSRVLAVEPPIAFARSDFDRAPRNETIYIPQELEFFFEPTHGI